MRSSFRCLAAGLVSGLGVGLVAASAARAGDITATLVKETLVIQGDDLGNAFSLSAPPATARGLPDSAVLVSPMGKGTTVNGTTEGAVFSPVRNVRIDLGEGVDTAQIIGLNLAGDLSFDGGGGSSQFYLDGATFQGKCTFEAGDDDDLLSVAGAAGCGDDTRILLGNGFGDVRLLAGSSFGGDLSLKLGSAADEVTLDTAITGSAKLSLGGGDGNEVTVRGSVGDDFSYKGGASRDLLGFEGFEAGGQVALKLGSGQNAVRLEAATSIGESLKLKAGPDDDSVLTDGIQIGEDAVLVLSAGDNEFFIMNTTIGDDLVVKAKSDTDTLTSTGNTIGGETIVKGVP